MQKVEIQIKGQIDRNWSDWFEGLKITYAPNGNTILSGVIRDQSALIGLIFNLSNIGLALISVDTLSRVEGHYGNIREKEATKR